MVITLAQAADIVDQALAHARRLNLGPMTVAVLDARGCLVALKSEDGSSLMRADIATAKAWGALGMGMGSRSLADRAARAPAFYNAITNLAQGRMVPVPGGVLVRSSDGVLLGAVGVSGALADHDEACARVAIGSGELVADPGEARGLIAARCAWNGADGQAGGADK